MLVTKCDLCRKLIKEDHVVAGIGWKRVELCDKCGNPIKRFLEKYKLIENKKKDKK